MNQHRSTRRVKTLDVEPIDPGGLKFRLTLEDKTHSADGEELIHSLAIEGELSLPDLVIRAIQPHAYHQPYPECAASLSPVQQLVGTRIGPGFRDRVLEVMGRSRGCTHFLSLALDLAAAHTMSVFLQMRARVPFEARNLSDGDWMGAGLDIEPRLENACIALRTESPIMARAKEKRRGN